jgi:hypothetical protein
MKLRNILLSLISLICFSPSSIIHGRNNQSGPLFVVIVNNKRGYINENGKIVIEPRFDGATPFSEELAVVAIDENGYREGYIDTSGRFVIEPQFDRAEEFSEGLALVGFDKTKKEIRIGSRTFISSSSHPSYNWGYIDRTGKYIVAPIYPNALGFSEGLAAVQIPKGKWGYIDRAGRMAIEARFQWASSFSEGLACVMLNGRFGFIDQTGKIVINPQFSSPGRFAEGLAAVRIGGTTLNPGTYRLIGPVGGTHEYIDKTGRAVIRLGGDIENASPFSEGLAAIEIKGYWGFINKTGEMVIEARFGGQPSFSEGLAFVIIKGGNGIGFIDETGTVVLKPGFALAVNYRDGLASVYESLDLPNTKCGYIDKSGKVIWHPTK